MPFISKSSKIIIFAEARWYVFKNAEGLAKKSKKGKLKDLNMGKLPPKEGVLLQHYLRSVVQARIHEARNARMNHVDPQEYGWKPSDEGFIPITTEDNKVPKLLCVDATQPTTQRDRAKMLLEWYPLLESV